MFLKTLVDHWRERFHLMVTSRWDYCNMLYVVLPLNTLQKLQVIQNVAARLVLHDQLISLPIMRQLPWLLFCAWSKCWF